MRRPVAGAPEFGKANFYATGKTGFTEGTPGVEAATVVTDDTLNHVVGELCNAIEVFGATALDALKYDQLSTVLAGALTRGIVASAQNDVRTGFLQVAGLSSGITGNLTDFQARPIQGGSSLQYTAVGGTPGSAVSIRYSNDYGVSWTTPTIGGAYNNCLYGICQHMVYGAVGEIQAATFSGNVPTYARQKNAGADIISMCMTPDAANFICVDSAGHTWSRTIAASTWTDGGVKLGVGTVTGDLCTGLIAGTGYIAVCDNGQVKRTSNNGTTWTAATMPGGGSARQIIYTGQPGFEWVVGCEPGGILKSTDLQTFTAISPAIPATYAYGLTPIVGGFLAAEYQPPSGLVTYDGVSVRSVGMAQFPGWTPNALVTKRPYKYMRMSASNGLDGQVYLVGVVSGPRVSRMAEAFPPPAGVYP